MRQVFAANKSMVSWIMLQKSYHVVNAKVVHQAGDRKWLFWKYDEPIIKYHGSYYTLDDFKKLVMVGIKVIDGEIIVLPQVKTYRVKGLLSGTVETQYYKSDEEAEKDFNLKVKEYGLYIKDGD